MPESKYYTYVKEKFIQRTDTLATMWCGRCDMDRIHRRSRWVYQPALVWAEIQCRSCFRITVIMTAKHNLGWSRDCGHLHSRYDYARDCEDGVGTIELVRKRRKK